MIQDRYAVLYDPFATHAVQTIAAFASLHVGIMVTVCLMAELLGMKRWIRVGDVGVPRGSRWSPPSTSAGTTSSTPSAAPCSARPASGSRRSAPATTSGDGRG